jgi:hypothetical protein
MDDWQPFHLPQPDLIHQVVPALGAGYDAGYSQMVIRMLQRNETICGMHYSN